MSFVPLWINGKHRSSGDGATFDVCNPWTQDVVTKAASATLQDCEDAIVGAGEAFKTWEKTSIEERLRIFHELAQLAQSEKYVDKVLEASDAETAFHRPSALASGVILAGIINDAIQEVDLLKEEVVPSYIPGGKVHVQRRPLGVVYGMSPWNGGLTQAVRAVATPIFCGNTVVLRTSELSVRTHSIVTELFKEAGLPDGVLNVIHISKENTPEFTKAIIGHPLVRKICFTGSDTVGRLIAIEAAKHLKPCVLELGGNGTAVVLNDADVENAARAIVSGGIFGSGQFCISTDRVIAQRKVSETLTAMISKLVSQLRAAEPSDLNSHLGCLFSSASAERLIKEIAEAQAAGAEIVVGDGKHLRNLLQPHVLKGVKPGTKLWERESFGPVLAIAEVDTVEEAIELARANTYSLHDSVWSRDEKQGYEVARQLNTCSVMVNGSTLHTEPGFLGGSGGLGGSTGYGRFSVEQWTEKRMISILPSGIPFPMTDGLNV